MPSVEILIPRAEQKVFEAVTKELVDRGPFIHQQARDLIVEDIVRGTMTISPWDRSEARFLEFERQVDEDPGSVERIFPFRS